MSNEPEPGVDPTAGLAPPTDLRVDHATDPVGVPLPPDGFQWRYPAEGGLDRQTAFRLVVGETAAAVSAPVEPDAEAVVWDTGRVVASDPASDPALDAYDGPALEPDTRYQWAVRAWDEEGRATDWSDPATFHTTLAEWDADWLQAPIDPDDPPPLAGEWIWHQEAAEDVAIRRTFEHDGPVERAVLVVAADDAVRVSIDGQEVWITQPRRIPHVDDHVDAADVTSAVDAGEHAIGLAATATDPGEGGVRASLYVQGPAGETVVHTDETWRAATDLPAGWGEPGTLDPGPAYRDGWSVVGYDDGDWTSARVRDRPDSTPADLPMPDRVAPPPNPLFRRSFELEAAVDSARLYLTGLGVHEATLNDEPVGDDVLAPATTDYDESVLYRAIEVGELLETGTNVLAVALGRGRYGESVPDRWGWHQVGWHDDPVLRCELRIDLENGEQRVVRSDEEWQTAPGPTRFDGWLTGETFDAREKRDGWRQSKCDVGEDGDWNRPRVVDGPEGTLRTERIQPMEVTDTIAPDAVDEPVDDVRVYDLGVMVAGWARLTVDGESGTRLTLRLGEKVRDDGTVPAINDFVSRPMADTYVLDGEGTESWEPRFSYTGFRYVQVEGEPTLPDRLEIEGRVVHTTVDEDPTGSFDSSDALLNRIHENTRRAFLNNCHGLPTDTPTYEKNGWTGDAVAMSETAMANFSMARFWRKWLRDCRETIRDGDVAHVAPTTPFARGSLDPAWQAAYPIIAWQAYRWSGDPTFLTEHYDGMCEYVAYVQERADDGIVRDGRGDWAAPLGEAFPDGPVTRGVMPPEGPDVVSTVYYYRTLQATAATARVLGRADGAGPSDPGTDEEGPRDVDAADAERYEERARAVRERFNGEFLQGDHYDVGDVESYRQTSNALPLAAGMVPADRREAVAARLARNVREEHDGHLDTGVHGTAKLLRVLSATGYEDLAYTVATQRTYPSWGFWIEQGATALYEYWPANSRSRNHHFQGSIDGWCYEYLAGIRPPTAPGYAHVTIAPRPPSGLERAGGEIQTVRGPVASRWERKGDGGLNLSVSIPPTSEGTVRVPRLDTGSVTVAINGQVVWQSGRASAAADGVRSVNGSDGSVYCDVGSGSYQFQVRPR
jgi:alpha-L-rhamnosidase